MDAHSLVGHSTAGMASNGLSGHGELTQGLVWQGWRGDAWQREALHGVARQAGRRAERQGQVWSGRYGRYSAETKSPRGGCEPIPAGKTH